MLLVLLCLFFFCLGSVDVVSGVFMKVILGDCVCLVGLFMILCVCWCYLIVFGILIVLVFGFGFGFFVWGNLMLVGIFGFWCIV